MKRIADLRSLGFLFAAWALQLGALFIAPADLFLLTGLFFLNLFAVFVISLINHNHRHCHIFTNRRLNRAVNVVLSLVMLAPSTRLHAVHVLNHHAHYDGDQDWASYKLIEGRPRGFWRSAHYLQKAIRTMQKNRGSLKLSREMKTSLLWERGAIVLYSVAALLLTPKVFIFWLLPSCSLGLLLLLLANLINHDECDLQSSLNHSRNFTSPLENFFFCNNGYHTAHHLKPSMHWSDYPSFHRTRLVGHIEAHNEERSFVAVLLQRYLLRW